MDVQTQPGNGRSGVARNAGWAALAVIVGAVVAYLIVSVVLAATTGIDLPLTNWPF
jgi:hypothetical protein